MTLLIQFTDGGLNSKYLLMLMSPPSTMRTAQMLMKMVTAMQTTSTLPPAERIAAAWGTDTQSLGLSAMALYTLPQPLMMNQIMSIGLLLRQILELILGIPLRLNKP